jgi:isoleucyl-tRNA synthetase
LPLNIDGQEIEILKEDVEIFSQDIPGWSVVNDGTLTVALDLEITENLRQEGIAREVVKRIQAYRKDNDFKITDHIHVVMEECAEVKASVESFKDYICSQVLCDKWEWGTSGNTEFVFDEYKLKVTIQKL